MIYFVGEPNSAGFKMLQDVLSWQKLPEITDENQNGVAAFWAVMASQRPITKFLWLHHDSVCILYEIMVRRWWCFLSCGFVHSWSSATATTHVSLCSQFRSSRFVFQYWRSSVAPAFSVFSYLQRSMGRYSAYWWRILFMIWWDNLWFCELHVRSGLIGFCCAVVWIFGQGVQSSFTKLLESLLFDS